MHNTHAPLLHLCRYPGPGYPLLLRLGKDSRSYPKLRAEEQSSRTPAVRSPPRRASGPGPALRSGEGPVTPRVLEKATPGADSRGSPDLPCHPDPRLAGNQHFTQEESGAVTCPRARARVFRRKTRPPTAFNAGGWGVLCRRRARGSLCQTPLLVAYYQGAQCSRRRRVRGAR